MNIERFADLLKRTMGLDAASIGLGSVARAVAARAGTQDLEAYWGRLGVDTDELQALIEEVVVPETWFFRDGEAFAALGRLAAARRWAPASTAARQTVVRLLSLPCSTGEEPYSMAMTMLDAGLDSTHFEIDALDISERALERARRGVYSSNAFRGLRDASGPTFRERYFEAADAGNWAIDQRVRALVRFERANLLDRRTLPSTVRGALYDFIFCRNVLIYFDRATQLLALEALEALLAPGGMIFVGPAETGLMVAGDFAAARIPLAFGFTRPAPLPPAVPRSVPVPAPSRLAAPPPVPPAVAASARLERAAFEARARAARQGAASTLAPPLDAPLQPAASAVALSLDRARALADAGQLGEAARLAQQQLDEQGPSAELFCFLGLLADAGGDAGGARSWYGKAVYLEPTHAEALTHLAALLDIAGDTHGARLMSERATRAQAGRSGKAT